MRQCNKIFIVKGGLMSILLILIFLLSFHLTQTEQFQSKLSPFTLNEGISSFCYLEGRLDSLGIKLQLCKNDNHNLIFEIIPVPEKRLDLNTISPLIILVIKQCENGIQKVVSQQYYSIRSSRGNCIKVSQKVSKNCMISFGCFRKEDLYRKEKDEKYNLIFYQYVYENN